MAEIHPIAHKDRDYEHVGGGASSSLVPHPNENEFSNKIFIHAGKEVTTYYIPTYLSVLFKKFGQFDFANGTLEVSMTLILRIYIEEMNEEERDAVRSIKMRVNEEETIMFDKESAELKELDGFFVFTMRVTRKIDFLPTIDNFPFDIQRLKIKYELTSKSVTFPRPAGEISGKGKEKARTSVFRFNTHYNPEEGVMHSFKFGTDPNRDEVDRILELNLAYGKITCETPGEKKGQEHYFPIVEFYIPLYREPEYVLLSSFVPLVFLNLLTICIFVINPLDYVSRLGILAIILLSLFAFLPSYRRRIPFPSITVLDIALFQTMLVMLLVIVDSFAMTLADQYHGRIAMPVVSAGVVFSAIVYILYRYSRYLDIRKDLIRKPSTSKKTSAKFSNSTWYIRGASFPEGAKDILDIRGRIMKPVLE